MKLPSDPKLLDIACDVTIRFKGHDSYGSRQKAIAALRRRAPGYHADEYATVLEFLCEIYDLAVEIIPRHVQSRPEKMSRVAEFDDIDYAACYRKLNTLQPGQATAEKKWILNWTIYWSYLR